jgi:hypothetical protein
LWKLKPINGTLIYIIRIYVKQFFKLNL